MGVPPKLDIRWEHLSGQQSSAAGQHSLGLRGWPLALGSDFSGWGFSAGWCFLRT